MQKLDEIVKLYLEMETNYALMITGEWGVGKTYYYQNVLETLISNTNTFNNQSKKYRPIRISLFGLKSIEDIQSEIFLAIYPILKSKTVKFGGRAAKLIIKGFMHLKGLGKVEEYLDTALSEKDKLDFISFDELVLCFDDLERISENLKIEELIGYINSLVENENIKVLIIANENKISEEKYGVLKEKIVGNSIEFNLDVNETFDSLAKSKFQSFPNYLLFLNNNKNYILQTFSSKSSNLRTLGFALAHFQYIYSDLSANIIDEPALEKNKEAILSKLLKFTIAICIEYKAHKITFNKKEELDTNDYSTLERLLSSKKTEKKTKSYKELFLEQYYNAKEYYFFSSVYDFITGGNIFKYEDLKNELKKLYHIEDKKILPQYELFESLKYMQVFSLNDKEYKECTYKMLKYVDNGEYDLATYISTFYFATRFENPYHFNLENLEKRIIKGMNKGKGKYKYISSLDFHLTITSDSENIENLKRIRDEALKINSTLGEVKSSIVGESLEELFYTDFSRFNDQFFDKKNGFIYDPVLKYFNPNKFYTHFLHTNNGRRWEIIGFLTGRYRRIHPEIASEIDFLEKLNHKVEKKISSLRNNQLSTFLFRELHRKIKVPLDSINSLKTTK